MAQEQKYVIEIMGYVHEQNFKLDSKVHTIQSLL